MNKNKHKQKVVMFIKTELKPLNFIDMWNKTYPDIKVRYLEKEGYLLEHKVVGLTASMVMIRLDGILRSTKLHASNLLLYYPEDLEQEKNNYSYKLKKVRHAIRSL